jgi:hypothetical protein
MYYTTDSGPNEMQVWGRGTLTLDTLSPQSVTGVLTLPGWLNEPISFSGSTVPPGEGAASTVIATGQSSEAQLEATISYNQAGDIVHSGSYVGGLVDLLYGEEWILYVIQGFSPQQLSGAKPADQPDM